MELGSDGQPTEQAKTRRENQVKKSYEDLTNKFFADCEAVKQSTMPQQQSLLQEIRADQKALGNICTVSSMGDELKVSFGTYEGSKNGWNAYLSLYSDGVLLYTDNFIVNYEAFSGKKAPNVETELDDAVIQEYANNVDMYNSLLVCGNPIVYFEIDYNVKAGAEDKENQYEFNFNKLRVINTVSGKTTQTKNLNIKRQITMKPEWDLREFAGVVDSEKNYFARLKAYFLKGQNLRLAIKCVEEDFELENEKEVFFRELNVEFVKIPGKNMQMLTTEVTQELYEAVMDTNPSYFRGNRKPVENVTLLDAVRFCNSLSEKFGFESVYTITGDEAIQNINADGYRLPTEEEWLYAAKGGQNFMFSGSNNLDEVAWYKDNSDNMTHAVALKKPNAYGLYDMNGNVGEWNWNSTSSSFFYCGGQYFSDTAGCSFFAGFGRGVCTVYRCFSSIGFRIVRNVSR